MNDYKQKKHMICINDFGVVDREVFMSNGNFNALIIYDLENWEISHIEQFVGIVPSVFSPHRICKVYNKKVFFFPQNGNVVNVFDVQNRQQQFFEAENSVQSVFCTKTGFYLLPYYGKDGMIFFDADSPEMYEKVKWWDSDELKNAKSIRSGEYSERKIWTHCVGTNTLLITDIWGKTIEKYKVNLGKNSIHNVEFDGNDFWISVESGSKIYKWNIVQGVQDIFDVHMNDSGGCPYKIFICIDGIVFVFLRGKKQLFLLDDNRRELVLLSNFPNWVIYPNVDWTVYYKRHGDTVYLFCNFASMVIAVDMKSLKVSYYSTVVEKSQIYEEYMNEAMRHCLKDCMIEENVCYDWKKDINSYLNMVMEYA
ncbi:hypothetical protein [Sporofaciens musculi]|uniref:hypothetical protein n=1 Tax=Sporofaciens musculi TaxID=2681861 RepID=UPI0025A11C75|nr:hypothetical protein [Sporofaciens musculi]